MNKTIASCITGAILALGATSALADVSVALSPANPPISPIGANSGTLSVTFTGDGNGTSYSGGIAFDDAAFDVTTLVSVDATCSAPTDEDGAGVVTVTFSDGGASALPNGTACTFVLDHVGAAAGSFPYNFVALSAEDLNGTITITGGTGNVVVSAGPPTAPTVTFNPAAGAVPFPAATSIGGTTQVPYTAAPNGGANGGTADFTLALSGPNAGSFSILNFTSPSTCTAGGSCTDGAFEVQCTATNAAQTATLTATVTPTSPAGAPSPVVWTLNCPAANVAPTIGATTPPYGPADATPEITFTQTGIGQTNTQTISVPASGGSGTSTATYNCSTASAGFAVTGGNNLTFTGSTGPTPQTVSVQCTATALAQTGTLTCVETDSDSAGVSRNYDLACPAGLAVAPPTATYSAPPTFGQGAAVGSAVPGSAPYTVDIVGGISDGAGGAESLQVTCALFNSPAFSAVFTPSNTATANAPAPAGTDISAAITCSAPADVPAAGTIRCTEVATVNGVQSAPFDHDDAITCPAAAVNVTSNPADNSTINLFGVPATTLNGSVGFTNIGSTSTLGCTATGTVVLGVVPATIPASGSATVPFTCTAGAAGAANTGTIQCTTQDPDNAVFDFTVNCSGLASNPIPAINDLGKVLMAALVIGLGLLGLGLRRQTV